MIISPKTLLTITAVSVLMAGTATAQEAEQIAPAPEGAVAAETMETVEAPTVEVYEREAVEDAVVDGEVTPETTLKIVEDVEVIDSNTIEAVSETPEVEVEVEVEAEVEAETVVEETIQPED